MRYCISDVNMEGFLRRCIKNIIMQPKFTAFCWFNQSLRLSFDSTKVYISVDSTKVFISIDSTKVYVSVDSTKFMPFELIQPKFMPFCCFNQNLCLSVDSTEVYAFPLIQPKFMALFFFYNKISLVFQYLLSLKKCTR